MTAQPPMPPVIDGSNVRGIANLIALCTTHNSTHHIPLFQSVGTGRIVMTGLHDRLSRPNLNALNKAHQPGVILIADDEGNTTGPLGWVATSQMLAWANGAMVHATGGDRASYVMAVMMAETSGRFLLIETSSDAADSWAEVLVKANIKTVILKPSGDGLHPVEPDQGRAS